MPKKSLPKKMTNRERMARARAAKKEVISIPIPPAPQIEAQTPAPPSNPETARRNKAIIAPGLRALLGGLIASGLVAGGASVARRTIFAEPPLPPIADIGLPLSGEFNPFVRGSVLR